MMLKNRQSNRKCCSSSTACIEKWRQCSKVLDDVCKIFACSSLSLITFLCSNHPRLTACKHCFSSCMLVGSCSLCSLWPTWLSLRTDQVSWLASQGSDHWAHRLNVSHVASCFVRGSIVLLQLPLLCPPPWKEPFAFWHTKPSQHLAVLLTPYSGIEATCLGTDKLAGLLVAASDKHQLCGPIIADSHVHMCCNALPVL